MNIDEIFNSLAERHTRSGAFPIKDAGTDINVITSYLEHKFVITLEGSFNCGSDDITACEDYLRQANATSLKTLGGIFYYDNKSKKLQYLSVMWCDQTPTLSRAEALIDRMLSEYRSMAYSLANTLEAAANE